MKKTLQIGQCPICYQGMLEIVKEKKTNIIFVACDECEAEWENPISALKRQGGSRGKYGEITYATKEDVQKLNWGKYIL